MHRHHPCDGKHQLDANLTLKVWTLVVSTRLQSRLAMPRWSKPAASSLSKLPLGPLKVAEATGMASEATWQRRTASGPRWPYDIAGLDPSLVLMCWVMSHNILEQVGTARGALGRARCTTPQFGPLGGPVSRPERANFEATVRGRKCGSRKDHYSPGQPS